MHPEVFHALDGGRGGDVRVVLNQPAVFCRFCDIAVADGAEGEIQAWRQGAVQTLLAEGVANFGLEAWQRHGVGVLVGDVRIAQHHQAAGHHLAGFVPPFLLQFRFGGHEYRHIHRVAVLHQDGVGVRLLVFQFVGLAFRVFGTHFQPLAVLAVLHFHVGRVVQRDLLGERLRLLGVCLVVFAAFGILVVLAILTVFSVFGVLIVLCVFGVFGVGFVSVVRVSRTAREPFLGLSKERHHLVEGGKVELAVEVDGALARGGVAQRCAVFKLCSANPSVGGVVRTVSADPCQHRNFVQRQFVGAGEGAGVGQWTAERGDAVAHRVFPCLVGVWVERLVDHGVRLFYLGMGGGGVAQLHRLEDVPAHREVTVPEELLGEVHGQLSARVNVAFLQLIVAARDVGVEGDTLWQVVQVLRLDDVQPFRFAFQVLEWLPRLVFRAVAVRQVGFPILVDLIHDGLARNLTLAVGIAESEVGWVPWHRNTARIVRLPVRQREVLVLRHRLSDGGQGVALKAFKLVEGVLQQHVGVERIVFRRNFLPGVGIVNRETHLPFLWEQLAKLPLGGQAPFVQVVVATFVHALFQSAEAVSLHVAGHVHAGKVAQLHVQVALGGPAAVVVVAFHAQLVHPHLHAVGLLAVVAHTDHHRLDLAQRWVTHHADLVVWAVIVVGGVEVGVAGGTLGAGFVALMLHGGEFLKVDVEHVLLWPHGLAALGGVGVVVAGRGQHQRNLIFIVVALVVGTHTQEHAHLVVLKLGVTFHRVGVDEHLQVLVLAKVVVQGFVNGTGVTGGEVLHLNHQCLLVLLAQLWLLRILNAGHTWRQHVVHWHLVVVLFDVYG